MGALIGSFLGVAMVVMAIYVRSKQISTEDYYNKKRKLKKEHG